MPLLIAAELAALSMSQLIKDGEWYNADAYNLLAEINSEMRKNTCETCQYFGEDKNSHCYMFKVKPDGMCMKWKRL